MIGSHHSDPMDRTLCGWGDCAAPVDPRVPLCHKHLIKAWSFVENTRRHALRSDPAAPPPMPMGRWTVPPTDHTNSIVYYFAASRGIKIGRTADLRARMSQLMVPMDDVLAVEPGGADKEKHRHGQFAHLRIARTEFFRSEADLLDHVAQIRETFGDPLAVAEDLRRFVDDQLDIAESKR